MNRHIARIILLLLILPVGLAGTAAAQTLSRAEAVSLALGANPRIKESLERVNVLEGRITEEKAAALPEITWNTYASRSRDPGLLNSPNFDAFPPEFREALSPLPANAFSTQADVKQTLYSFKLGAALAAARLAKEAGQHEVARARQQTVLDTIQAYNQLLFAREQLRVMQTNLEAKQSHYEFAQNRRAAGAATELEVLRAQVDVENQRAETRRAENQVASAQAQLNTIMLRPTNMPIVPTDVLRVVPFTTTFDEAEKEAIKARPELQLLRVQEQVQGKLVDVARGDMRPSFDFSGSYGYAVRRPQNLFQYNYTRWASSINVKVPIFDGRRTAGRVAQATGEKNALTQQIVALESQVRYELQTWFDALAVAERTIEAADLNVTQARRAAEMTEANYRLGAATQLDVLDAQQSLRDAENIRNLALYTHANARATLRFVIGRDPLEGQ